MRTTRRSTALLATAVLALGGLTAACEDDGDGVDDDVEREVEEDLTNVDDSIDEGLDEVEEELDGEPDDTMPLETTPQD